MKSKTFYRVTNKEIYEKIQCIEKQLNKLTVKTSVNAALVAVAVSIVVGIVVRMF